jgi:multidrug efflux pump subunit AcrA (membrane-fusion protein)
LETKKTRWKTTVQHKEEPVILRETFVEHGNEVEDIISARPPFIVRWGITFFFLMLLVLIFICWLIKYPDIVTASVRLTSINAPKPVMTTTAGKLIKLFITENEVVDKEQIVGYIESTAKHENAIRLSIAVDSMLEIVNRKAVEQVKNQVGSKKMQLGELQTPYQTFSQAYLTFACYLRNGFYLRKKQMLLNDKENLNRLHANLLEQKRLKEQDVSLSQKTFTANQQLANDKVISEFDYTTEKSNWLNKQLTLPQINSDIISNESQQNDKKKEIAELNNTIAQQLLIFQQALSTLKSQIDEWKKKYLLIAPIAGKVAFASYVQENQQLQSNQIICFVNPENSHYFAQITIPQSNLGKIAIGQKVLLKFPSYPFQEYGALNGRVDFISHITTDSGYYAKVTLINGLRTSFNSRIQYREGLKGQAEIITHDMRLLERLYFSLSSQIKK